jgi:predicted CXXCH cytochrome family protein
MHKKWLLILAFGFVAAALLTLPSGAVAQSDYVGTETCNNCHGKEADFAGNQWATWVKTRHNMKWRDPDEGFGVVIRDAFINNLDLSADPDFAAFGANAPKLSFDSSDPGDSTDGKSGYRVTIGATTYEVNWTLGGSGEWKQRYMTKIGNSIYILPIQYNDKAGDWVTYSPSNWYDNNNNPIAAVDPSTSYERRCIGCHSVNPEISFDDVSGEYTATITERNIGCESCHGPGGPPSHTAFGLPGKGVNPDKLTDPDRQLEVCGACHSRGSSTASLGGKTFGYPYSDTEGAYQPGKVLADFFTQTTASKRFWPNEFPYGRNSKSHRQQYLDFRTSEHYENPFEEVNCWSCHDPHGDTPNKWLIRDKIEEDELVIATENDNNTLCLACHAGFEPFADIRTTTVANITDSDSLAAVAASVQSHTRHSYDPTGPLATSRCSKCHNPKVAKSAIPYDIHSHTFWVLSPEQTLFYQSEGGSPNSCATSCHIKDGFPNFGIDFSGDKLTDWTEATDIALADTLKRYYGPGGLWWDTGVPLEVEELPDGIPSTYRLTQNYPNPFNPSTKITFEIVQSGFVNLKVYNVLGQEVGNLVRKALAPGRYVVEFNGSSLSSGIYIYRLEVNGFVESRKMVLAK